jgi:hypothetical protein
MDKNLKHLYDSDSGFAEFVDRFDLSAADPATLKEYDLWVYNQHFLEYEFKLREDASRAEGMAEGMAKAHLETALSAFRECSAKAFESTAKVLRSYKIPEDRIQAALNQVKAERAQKNPHD